MCPTRIGPGTRRTARRLRRTATRGERALWRHLRDLKNEGMHVRRQAPVGVYIADFAVFSRKLIIEVDGEAHHLPGRPQRDAARDAGLTGQGFEVMRFSTVDIDDNLEGVVTLIRLRLGLPTTGYPHP